jgi:hypothetical protein
MITESFISNTAWIYYSQSVMIFSGFLPYIKNKIMYYLDQAREANFLPQCLYNSEVIC